MAITITSDIMKCIALSVTNPHTRERSEMMNAATAVNNCVVRFSFFIFFCFIEHGEP